MKPSLASCQTRCTGEKTPFMTYKKDGNCRCDKTCNNYRKYSNCSSGGDVYKAGAGPAPTPKPTDAPAAGGWALVKACHFCPENNGSWGKQPSLDACKKRCLGENTPFMTFKRDKNCRCDRTCNSYKKYGNCDSGGDVYKAGAGPAPTPKPTESPTESPTEAHVTPSPTVIPTESPTEAHVTPSPTEASGGRCTGETNIVAENFTVKAKGNKSKPKLKSNEGECECHDACSTADIFMFGSKKGKKSCVCIKLTKLKKIKKKTGTNVGFVSAKGKAELEKKAGGGGRRGGRRQRNRRRRG